MTQEQQPKPAPIEWMPHASIRPMAGPIMPVIEMGVEDHVKFGTDLFDDSQVTYYDKSLPEWSRSLKGKAHAARSIQNIAITVFVAREKRINAHVPEEEREKLLLTIDKQAYIKSLSRRYRDLERVVVDSITRLLGTEGAGQVMEEIKAARSIQRKPKQ